VRHNPTSAVVIVGPTPLGLWSCNASVTCWPSWHLTPQRLWGIRCAEPSRQRSAPQHLFWMFRYKHGHIASKVPQQLGYYSAHGAALHAGGHVELYSPDRCGHLWQTATQRACGNTHQRYSGGLQSSCKRDSFWELDRWGGGVACRERHPPLPRDTPQPPPRGSAEASACARRWRPHHHRLARAIAAFQHYHQAEHL
jgi:hypothetical protein